MAYALVTGASKGIGLAIAEELAARAFDVLLVARSEDALKQAASSIAAKYKVKTDFLAMDLSLAAAPQTVYNWCRVKGYAVQVLVNNAGYGLSGSFEKYSQAENMNMMQLNMLAPVQMCQLFLPGLREQSKSYIMNIASSAAYQAVPGLSLYAASKAFVLSFSRGLAQELRGSGVSVTCVSPGATDTDFAYRAQIGAKGLKAADKVNMTPVKVASIAVKAMMARKPEVITGVINKAGAFLVWLLPKVLVERTAMKLYK